MEGEGPMQINFTHGGLREKPWAIYSNACIIIARVGVSHSTVVLCI